MNQPEAITLTQEQRARIIEQIVTELKIEAHNRKDYSFCTGDTFFSLAFKTNKDLLHIAALCNINVSKYKTSAKETK